MTQGRIVLTDQKQCMSYIDTDADLVAQLGSTNFVQLLHRALGIALAPEGSTLQFKELPCTRDGKVSYQILHK